MGLDSYQDDVYDLANNADQSNDQARNRETGAPQCSIAGPNPAKGAETEDRSERKEKYLLTKVMHRLGTARMPTTNAAMASLDVGASLTAAGA